MKTYLETERMVLREFTPEDEQNLFELDSDPEVMRFLSRGVPSTREQIHATLGRILETNEKHAGRLGFWAAIERASGQFMGWFHFRPEKSMPEDLQRIELGYRLKRRFWGKGFATEGSRALIDRGFDELGVEEVFALTLEENLASQRVMQKVGLTYVRQYNDDKLLGYPVSIVEYSLQKRGRISGL